MTSMSETQWSDWEKQNGRELTDKLVKGYNLRETTLLVTPKTKRLVWN